VTDTCCASATRSPLVEILIPCSTKLHRVLTHQGLQTPDLHPTLRFQPTVPGRARISRDSPLFPHARAGVHPGLRRKRRTDTAQPGEPTASKHSTLLERHRPANGLRLGGERSGAERVRCSRGFGARLLDELDATSGTMRPGG
jgi:hypothetical protein